MITGDVDVLGDLDSSFGAAGHKTQQNVFKRKWKKGSGDSVDHAFKEFCFRKAKLCASWQQIKDLFLVWEK